MGPSNETLQALYRTARTIRAFDDRVHRGLAAGEFMFNDWPVEGQEVISAGVCAALAPDDRMWTTYRGSGDAIAKGVPMEELAGGCLAPANLKSEPVPTGGQKDLSMAEAINQALGQVLEADERVILLGEDIADPVGGLLTCTAGLSTRFGTDRVRATPIAATAEIARSL